MFTRQKIGGKPLAQMCYRLGTSLDAGIDLRKALLRESERGLPEYKRQIDCIRDRIARGATLADAMQGASGYFPPLVCDMVGLGEATGKLDEVFLRLAEHYEGRLQLRRVFIAGIAWPMLQLAAAILVIGLLIWILGFVGNTDILGFGMMGTSGLLTYFVLVATVISIVAIVVRGAMRGWFWSKPLQYFLIRLPGLGPSLQTIALSRIAWTMSLTFNSGMDARRAIQLALGSAENVLFTDQTKAVERRIMEGGSVCAALRSTGVFPVDFLDSLQVGEESGRLAESMAHLADQYRDRATAAFRVLTVMAGFVVWGIVAAVIIFLIFRLAAFYFGMIHDAASGNF